MTIMNNASIPRSNNDKETEVKELMDQRISILMQIEQLTILNRDPLCAENFHIGIGIPTGIMGPTGQPTLHFKTMSLTEAIDHWKGELEANERKLKECMSPLS